MLLNCRTHQPFHAIDIYLVKMFLRRTANSAGAMHHSLNTVYQAPQAVEIFKRTLDPLNIKPHQRASIRSLTRQGFNFPSFSGQSPRYCAADETRCTRQGDCVFQGFKSEMLLYSLFARLLYKVSQAEWLQLFGFNAS